MADNTKMKELYVDVKKHTSNIKRLSDDFQIRFERLGAATEARFQHMEDRQSSITEKLDQINETLSLLLRNTTQNSFHGASNSNKAPFQVRNIKLDFPRFDGLNPEIRRDVMIHTPTSTVQVVSLAKVYEEKSAFNHLPQNKNPPSNPYIHRTPFNSNKADTTHHPDHTSLLQTPPTRPMNINQRNPNIKSIFPAEMQPFVQKNQQNKCKSSNLVPGVFNSNHLLDLYAKCGSLVDAQKVFDEMGNRDLCPHWVIMMGLDSIEPLLAQIDELQLLLLAPVSPRLPPKPPDVSYCTVGLVIESFVVDVPDGNTRDETCYFVEALIMCNLSSLADAIQLEHHQWLPIFLKQYSMSDVCPVVNVTIIEDIMVYLYAGPILHDYWFANQITTIDEAKRFYPLFGLWDNVALVLSIVMGMGPAIYFLYWGVNNYVPLPTRTKKKKPKMGTMESLKFLVSSTYIRDLATSVVAYGISINLVKVTWKLKLKAQFNSPNEYSSVMRDFSTATKIVIFTMMLLSQILFDKYGWGIAAKIKPNCRAIVTKYGNIKIEIDFPLSSAKITGKVADVVQLSIFNHRFMGIVEQMGKTLQRTSISTNIKERLDFSCALFDSSGGLVANAPHVPVHLAAMSSIIQWQLNYWGDNLNEGDVLVTNHPSAGGSHLPSITVVTPVLFIGKLVNFVANRGHHAEIGGITPGSMPPISKSILEEEAALKAFKLVEKGVFQEEGLMDDGSIVLVFHISQLQPFRGPAHDTYLPLPLVTSDWGPIVQPEAVLDSRTIIKGHNHIPHILIKGSDDIDNVPTWENTLDMQLNYPNFNLEDKVVFKGEGIVMNPSGSIAVETHEKSGNGQLAHITSSRLKGFTWAHV